MKIDAKDTIKVDRKSKDSKDFKDSIKKNMIDDKISIFNPLAQEGLKYSIGTVIHHKAGKVQIKTRCGCELLMTEERVKEIKDSEDRHVQHEHFTRS